MKILQKKNIFFRGGRTVEAGSVHQMGLTTVSDSLQNLRFAMLKTASSDINQIDLLTFFEGGSCRCLGVTGRRQVKLVRLASLAL